MTPQQALRRGASFLDEATENLTFDEFQWAFEEVWRGAAWVLNALAEQPLTELSVGPKGDLPRRGSLRELLTRIRRKPRTADVVTRLESARATLGDTHDLEAASALDRALVEQLVFETWEFHNEAGERLAVADDRLDGRLFLTEVSPGRVGSPVIHRRTALKLLAATSVVPLAACEKVEQDNRPSATAKPVEGEADPVPSPAPAQVKAVTPLEQMHWKTTDPFLFCAYHLDDYPAGNDAMGPAASLDGRHLGRDFEGRDNWRMYHGRTIPGFPRHPHRGFETVTVVRSGMLDHSDSMGATARYGGGDVQWLTAGRGIQHAEMFPLLRSDSPNPLELFQIWLNLPRQDKMVDPHFTMLWSEKIPRVVERDAEGRLVELTIAAGRYGEETPPAPPPSSWASRRESDLAIWTIRMEARARFELPAVSPGTKRSLYVHAGEGLSIAGVDVPNRHRVEVDDPGQLPIVAGPAETEVLLLQGRPIDEPVAKRGPFVMNTQEEIRQAYSDYRRTQFGGWPWTENDPVHVRTKGRFARHIDGTFEEPT